MARKTERPHKILNLKQAVADCVNSGRYRFSKHALERQDERRITLPEVRDVLLTGRHDARFDEFEEGYQTWKYRIQGKTSFEGPEHRTRELRIVIRFEPEEMMLIITVMESGLPEGK